ncbi:MAG TPA: hypothetical protein PLA64_13585, partial [Mesotoga infera]|nr:hypothetical protein [Mesotoga infera]
TDMYVATMKYRFVEGSMENACQIWRRAVLERAVLQKSFIRGFIMTSPSGRAIAVGMWEDKSFADEFMKTGVYKELLSNFSSMLVSNPVHEAYEMKYYLET